jgi:hypothetical protein
MSGCHPGAVHWEVAATADRTPTLFETEAAIRGRTDWALGSLETIVSVASPRPAYAKGQ